MTSTGIVRYHWRDASDRAGEVQRKLGVHFVEVGLNGLDRATFERGIREWQAKQTQNSTL